MKAWSVVLVSGLLVACEVAVEVPRSVTTFKAKPEVSPVASPVPLVSPTATPDFVPVDPSTLRLRKVATEDRKGFTFCVDLDPAPVPPWRLTLVSWEMDCKNCGGTYKSTSMGSCSPQMVASDSFKVKVKEAKLGWRPIVGQSPPVLTTVATCSPGANCP